MRVSLLFLLVVTLLSAHFAAGCDDGGDGDGDADGDVDADGDGDAGVECGDEEIIARYETCVEANDEASCTAAGGTWTTEGSIPYDMCICPTGQDDCTCTRASQCLSACIAPTSDGVMGCEGVTEGQCSSVSVQPGCYCFFDNVGGVSGACS